ncbi:exodeoxyribonuclease III [Deinococcus apachensis]|uniref:exodeoxyribonuclease III n=1 Tax=Deinococcus apachensis TaxID=309886 RepID=UPI0003A69FB3|nr:exodeoxyribonuclease III [Deinococcus apachensis]
MPSSPHAGCSPFHTRQVLVKLATWNVNSLNVRLPQVLAWLESQGPEVLALQETKLEDHRFPSADFAALGYSAAFSGQKTYNGVALLSRLPLEEVQVGVPGLEDEQRRVIAATVGGVRVVCLYVPNGQEVGSPKYAYKLEWLAAVREWLRGELAAHERLAVVGDFNVAPEDRDVHSPGRWEGQVLVSEPEREAFRALLGLGLHDAFRLFEQPERVFSWWNYGRLAFPRNWGLRIDHILVSSALAAECRACTVDPEPRRHERPSDHAPVIATFAGPVS